MSHASLRYLVRLNVPLLTLPSESMIRSSIKSAFVIVFLLHFQSTLSSIEILTKLEEKHPTCNISHFIVESTNYQFFLDDLTKLCSNSSTTTNEENRLICQIISKQIDLACGFADNLVRPSVNNYGETYKKSSLCLMRKVPLINRWIKRTFLLDEENRLNLTTTRMCSQLTSFNETKQLVRFLYKFGSDLRIFDQSETKNFSSKKLRRNRTENEHLEANGPSNPKLIVEGNVSSRNYSEPKEGIPLGRAGEEPAVEQLDGRPKPDPVDAVALYLKNENENRNWLGGQNLEQIRNVAPQVDRNPRPIFRIDPPSIHGVPATRKRNPFKPLSSRTNKVDYSEKIITNVLLGCLILIICYLLMRSRNKIFALIIEGLTRRRLKSERHIRLNLQDQRHLRLSQSTHQN